MDKVIDQHFERVERALSTLINSISTYNPSAALAHDLVTADSSLSQGLTQRTPSSHSLLPFLCLLSCFLSNSSTVSAHQAHAAELSALRHTSTVLDTQIRETLSLLTTTRTSLLAIPAHENPKDANKISYAELLSYARRISKTTMPSTYRQKEAIANAAAAAAAAEPTSASIGAGNTTPLVAVNGASTPTVGNEQTNTQTQNILPPDLAAWLNPLADAPFVPWPSEEYIKRGALASIQRLTESGIDPAGYDPEENERLEEERKREAEETERVRVAERERMEEERRRRVEQRGSVGGPSQAAGVARPPRAAFQLETFDDDEEED